MFSALKYIQNIIFESQNKICQTSDAEKQTIYVVISRYHVTTTWARDSMINKVDPQVVRCTMNTSNTSVNRVLNNLKPEIQRKTSQNWAELKTQLSKILMLLAKNLTIF